MAAAREQMRHLELDTRTFVAPKLRLPEHGTLPGSWVGTGAISDRGPRGRDTFRMAASKQLAAPGGGQTHRTTYGGKALHSPRERDEGMFMGYMKAYKAPGSPRRQVEMFYIRSNLHGPKEVRLIGKQEMLAGMYHLPSMANSTLATLSPRGAIGNMSTRPPRLSNHAVGEGDCWRSGWQKNGTRLQGDGVKWSGRPRKEPGDTSVFVNEPVPLLSPYRGEESKFWTRGQAQRRKTGGGNVSPGQEAGSPVSMGSAESPVPADSPQPLSPRAASNNGGEQMGEQMGATKWPRPEGSPWKSFIKQVKKKNTSYEDQAERFLGEAGKHMHQMNKLTKKNQILTRIPTQWLHASLTEVQFVACRLESLPNSFGKYTSNVTSLILEHNMLTTLPESVAQMTKLKHLGLTANRFDHFPDIIGKCTALEVLSMQCNRLVAVKASIGYCRELRAIYFKNNPLKKLALSIGALKQLSILSYDNTETMSIPPYEVGLVGHTAVIEWLKIFYHNIAVNFRCELRKNFLTPKAAFNHFDVERDGTLDKSEVTSALEFLKIDVKYFEYVWLTLDIDNSGSVDYWEFVQNMAASMEEVLKDPYEELAPFLAREVIQKTAALVCANPWNADPVRGAAAIHRITSF